jgi:hypothetical protein
MLAFFQYLSAHETTAEPAITLAGVTVTQSGDQPAARSAARR